MTTWSSHCVAPGKSLSLSDLNFLTCTWLVGSGIREREDLPKWRVSETLPGHDNVSPASCPDPREGQRKSGWGFRGTWASIEELWESWSCFESQGEECVLGICPAGAPLLCCCWVDLWVACVGSYEGLSVFTCVHVRVSMNVYTCCTVFPKNSKGVGFHPVGLFLEGGSSPALPTSLPTSPRKLKHQHSLLNDLRRQNPVNAS